MGFKRLVSLACDGPCGTVLAATEKAPTGWVKLMITTYERLELGEKPHHKPMQGWFCSKCSTRIISLLKERHFSLSEGKPEDKENAA